MQHHAFLLVPLAALVACSDGSTIGDGTGIWAFAAGGAHDVGLCALRRPAPAPLRCEADANAQRVGLATCGDLVADEAVSLDRRGSMSALLTAGRITTTAPLHVAGSLLASGRVEGKATQDVEGNLEAGGGWATTAPVTVGGDAWVTALEVGASATIAGALHAPQGSSMENVMCANVVYEPVDVRSPLDCPTLPSVRAIATAASRDSAAARVLSPLALGDVKVATDVSLGCGTYVLDSIAVHAPLAFHVVGPTVLIVQGNVHVAAPMTVDVADGASLDLVIVGRLDVDDTLRIGNDRAPRATWLGVGAAIHVAAPTVVHGVVYAPTAPVALDDTLVVHGAALLGPTRVAAPFGVEAEPTIDPRGCLIRD